MIRLWLLKLRALARWQQAALLAGLLIILTVGYIKYFTLYRYLTDKEQSMVNELLQNAQTRCIGVYLIDLPMELNPKGGMLFKFNGLHGPMLESKIQYKAPFEQFIQRRELELKGTKPVDAKDGEYLKRVYLSHDGMTGKVFERMESISMPDVARVLEGYKWDNDITFKIEMKADDGRASRYDEDRKVYVHSFDYNIPQKLDELTALFKRLHARNDIMIPNKPGLCILQGVLDGSPVEEYILGFSYAHQNISGLSIRFDTINFGADSYSLLDQDERAITRGKSKTVYKGRRTANGLPIEEWIVSGDLFSENKGSQFFLAIYEKESSIKKPKFTIRMSYRIPNDIKKQQVLTEAELITFWKEITSTIRLRENAFEQ
ncbi:hypothetical protein EKN56_11965 [Limnobaculum zhutongyuii]|uniref:Tle cognate immunity protein 4 C-terminal domain-containing protein n=1 Tax=Limnobaculum zhutongyuii TaxID=2498113 RepID=A0A411WLK8_9GAMM|nr:T6SS immunity protein Tli4 family protein [Limnobaculum zhutongyuii]QBH97050.1 hypothetical protein EKN56_11965 [Limnobaculum zhutongyuii]TQS87400.1 hypothetical protein ELQ32_13845 [Limnobaculum zhutongyuii]